MDDIKDEWIEILNSDRESGWSMGMMLEFYPSNPGLTPSQVKPQ